MLAHELDVGGPCLDDSLHDASCSRSPVTNEGSRLASSFVPGDALVQSRLTIDQ